ncbi:MAG: hypothetical protein HQ518_06710 [Rhodopirellula sp.]|nr:hypothetical protein [Rhodopirellula sp.]
MFPKSAVIAILGTILLGTLPAEGADWAFRQSWFSDELPMPPGAAGFGSPFAMTSLPPHALPNSRSAYRPAIRQRGPGFSIRSKYRYNNYRIYNGSSYDTTMFREFSFEESP